MQPDILVKEEFKPMDDKNDYVVDNSNQKVENNNISEKNSIQVPQPAANRFITPLQQNNAQSIAQSTNPNSNVISNNLQSNNNNNQLLNQVRYNQINNQ